MTSRDYVFTVTDGTNTETLTSSPWAIMSYVPNSPDPRSVDTLTDDDVVTESIELRVLDSTTAANLAEIQDLQKLLDQARRAQIDPSVARVYLTMKTTAAGTEYRSEIMEGKVEYDEEAMSKGLWENEAMVCTAYIVRRYYFEMSTAVQLDLDNHLVTNDTSGAPIYNPAIRVAANTIAFVNATSKITDSGNGLAHFLTGDTIYVSGSVGNDGTYTVATGGVAGEIVTNEALADEAAGADVVIVGAVNNYVEMDAADIGGVIKAPLRVELTNATGGNITFKDLHVGISQMNDMSNFIFLLEGEDFTAGGGADTASGTASGGYHCAITWAGDTETAIGTYALTAAMLAAARGNYFIALARLDGGTIAATISLRLNLLLGSTTVYEGPLVPLVASDELQNLGAMQLPPNLYRMTAPKALTLQLRAIKSGGGTINLDYIELMPIDAYKHVKELAYAVGNGESVFIDEFQKPELVYGVDATPNYYPVWIPRGSPLKVIPGVKARMVFQYDESDQECNVGNQSTVKVYYKARKLSF